MKQVAHTPTPWVAVGPHIVHTGAGFGAVCILAEPECKSTRDIRQFDPFISEREEEAEANAALIVRAVNSHAALVEILERIVRVAGVWDDSDSAEIPKELIPQARAALALVKGGE